jgi:hypothetical protein
MRIHPFTLIFGLGLFASASLLFAVQPMASKMVLPILGGSPAVWTTSMVFFQGALLAGYVYAFLSSRYLPLKIQILIHIGVLLVAFFFLPISISADSANPDMNVPQVWLLTILIGMVAMPFVAIAGSTTLLQNWFAHSSHHSAADPYFLYAASNGGSLLALLAYPVVLERLFDLDRQSGIWTAFYVAAVLLIAICGACVWKSGSLPGENMATPGDKALPDAKEYRPTLKTRVGWAAFAFVPSLMLMGVTLHITTDIASAPFLWVAPLAIYLVTFIVAFAPRLIVSRKLILIFQTYCLILLTIYYVDSKLLSLWAALALHLGVLLLSGLVCHVALADRRPPAAYLGEYYLWISVGGFIGGLTGGIIAPIIFDSVIEYPIAIILACLARAPLSSQTLDLKGLWFSIAAIVFFLTSGDWLQPWLMKTMPGAPIDFIYYGLIFIGLWLLRNRTLAFALLAGVVIIAHDPLSLGDSETLLQKRTFFGVHRVMRKQLGDGLAETRLIHGTTIHGIQYLGNRKLERQLSAYYHMGSPVTQVFSRVRAYRGIEHVGIVGLGAGNLACAMKDDERLTYFEIDPAVIDIAENPDYFSYLKLCGDNTTTRMGDGRLLLEAERDEEFDILIIDAFSSDAIPVHLMTVEAIDLYLRKISKGGLVVLHISNRHLDLAPVLAQIASTRNYAGLVQVYEPDEAATRDGARLSIWVVIAPRKGDLNFLRTSGKWLDLRSVPAGALWSDSYSNLLDVIRWTDK